MGSWTSASERRSERGRWRSELARERAAKVGIVCRLQEPNWWRLGWVATAITANISRTSMKLNTAIPSGGHRTPSRGPHSPSYSTVEGGDAVPLKLQNGA